MREKDGQADRNREIEKERREEEEKAGDPFN